MALADIKRLIKDSTGLDPESIGPSAVERAVRQRQRACRENDVEAYTLLLAESPVELQALIESVVVAETWFFRDAEAFATLARFVRNNWMRAHPAGVLRTLSLPCATGEEPYSMAIALLDAGVPADRFRVDAVDISERAIARGREGVFGRTAFRGSVASDIRRRHFTEVTGSWRIADAVRRQVQFHQGNVFSPALLPGAGPYDVIFSRNLLIYFDRPTQERAVDVLSARLAASGLVCVGPSETVTLMNRRFIADGLRSGFGFRKPADPVDARETTDSPAPLRFVPRGTTTHGTEARPDTATPASLRAAIQHATTLANAGRFEDAVRCCEDIISRHGPTPEAFYLIGLVRDAEGDALNAMSCYRKVIYLDPHHENALVHLALLLEALDRTPEAQRLRARAQRATLRSGA